MTKLIEKINQVGIKPEDSELIINKKRFVVYEAILMSFGGILWGILSLIIDRPLASVIPFGYVFLSLGNMTYFHITKKFRFVQGFQTGISLLLPFLFQWLLGGFYSSGGVMIWSLLSLAASLSYSNTQTSIFWFLIYLGLAIMTGVYDSTFQDLFPLEVSPSLAIALVTMNVCIVSALIFVLVIFYVLENLKSYSKITETQQLLIHSEKLTALGQLSAGIAHEINTPLGTIKAISQSKSKENQQFPSIIKNLTQNLSNEELDNTMEFILNHRIDNIFISTKEEREARLNLKKELIALDIRDETSALKLVQIHILKVPDFMKSMSADAFSASLEMLYYILMKERNNQIVLTSVEKASRVVHALKMYLHSTNENKAQKFNLKECFDTVLTIYQNQIKNGVDVQLKIDSNIEILGYSEEFSQVCTNLIVNACQAMNFKGKLNIECTENEKEIIIAIKDSGIGIESHVNEKIFKPFYTTKKAGEGSGLGLDIVKKIVDKHQGKIYYTSEINVGTTFYIELPKTNTL